MTDRLLKSHLEPLARSCHRWKLWRGLALCWVVIGLAGLAAILLERSLGWSSPLIFFALGLFAVVSGAVVAWRFRADTVDYQALARQIERENPQLHALLLTAVEQQPLSPTGELNYLQQRVVLEALDQYRRSAWGERIARRNYAALGAQWAALLFLLAVLVALRPHFTFTHVSELWAGADRSNGVSVTPGDASLERGSALVVLARFDDQLPVEAHLVINPVNDNEQNVPLTKNLEDPVFGGGIPQVRDDLKYHVEFPGGRTRDYKITVFDYPKLNHADATIDYPAYTGQPEKTIKDTRRVSAVEGSSLSYSFFLNKPVVSAQWVAKDAPVVSLAVDGTNATIYHTQLKLDQSRRYTLVLVDDAGRTNKMPPEFVLDALKNRPAEVKIDSPNGDQRVSALEEMDLTAEATGEFGLRSYGIAYTLGDGETNTVKLGEGGKPGEKRQFTYLLPLESLGAEPDQVLTYYAWADDLGPDGKTRHNIGDINLAEIKPFDEVFREAQPGAGQSSDSLLDLQKYIVTATWNLQRRETEAKPSDKYKDDVGVVHDSQQQALDQVRAMKQQAGDPRLLLLINDAETSMSDASGELGKAVAKNSTAPLPAALASEQSAYQVLLKIFDSEYHVARGGRGRGQNSSNRRGPRQVSQLELQQTADQYQTERAASSPQQREQLQIASRLKDLARRQQDLNDRLRDLQAALQEAKTPEQRADLQEQLKRLTEEQQDMLSDVDELRQRMDNAENPSQLAPQRQQLEQTRTELQRAAESLGQNAVPQALASGTRAQNELQQLQDAVRKMNSGEFADDMRRMRDDAGQLAQNEQNLEKKIDDLAQNQNLSETDAQRQQRSDIAAQLLQQKSAVSNLVDQMRQVSEQSETAEPLLSGQLYDTLRQTGLDQLDNSLDTTSEYVRRGFLRQAQPAEQPARQNIDQLKDGVDRAAASILGDDTEALRLAQRELQQLSQELNQGAAGNANGTSTNGTGQAAGEQSGQEGQGGQPDSNQSARANGGGQSDQQASLEDNQGSGQQGQGQGQTGNGRNGQRGSGQGQSDQSASQQAGDGNNPGNGGQDGQNGSGGEGQGQGQAQDSQQASASGSQTGGTGEANGGEAGSGGGAHGGGGLNRGEGQYYGPLTSDNYSQWSDGLRDVEEMVDVPDVSTDIARIRERARTLHLDFKRNGKRPDWAVITTQISTPLAEVRERLNEELLKRQSKDALVPLDRDPVPPKYSDQVRRYYEQLGKSD
jgi:hypothetical protein